MFEPLWTTQISIPLYHIMLILTVGTLTMIFGRMKLSLIIYSSGVLYWGYFLNPALKSPEGTFQMDAFGLFYMGFGIAVVFLLLIGLLTHQD